MFAKKLNQEHKPPHSYKLRDHSGNMITHPHGVLKIFSTFL